MYPLVIPIPPEKLCVHVYLRVQRYPLNRCWDVQGVVEKVKFLKPYQPKTTNMATENHHFYIFL